MKPRERRDSGQGDLLRSRLDAILDMDHQPVALARRVDWGFLEKRFGEVYRDGPGQPPLPTRLMAGLTIQRGWPRRTATPRADSSSPMPRRYPAILMTGIRWRP